MPTNLERLTEHNERLTAMKTVVNTLPNAPVYETWIFELEDGTSVEKRVEVSA